jgi:thiol-disulfide isomerase/thioredoxin
MTTPPSTARNPFTFWKVLLPVVIILAIIVGALSYLKSQTAANPEALELRVGGKIPAFTLQQFQGGPVPSTQLKGKVIMVNFWATWCEACMVEMPSIIQLRNHYKDKGFELVAVNVDENPEAVLPRTLKSFGMSFPVYTDQEGHVSGLFDVQAIPLTVIMNQNREILFIETGGHDWDGQDIRIQMDKWLSR